MPEDQELQRAIRTPIVTYEKPVEEPFKPAPPPFFSRKQAEELDRIAVPTTLLGVPGAPIPVAKVDRYTGTDQTYKEIVKWRVQERTEGELKEVSIVSNNYDKTYFKLIIGGITFFTDKKIQAPLTLPFPETKLRPAQEVILQCKSVDGTSIVVDASITARELPT